MPDSLQDLESRRAHLVKEFARLGDLRSGSVSDTWGRCGKPNCHCHQPGQPLHGPNARLTYKAHGKTVTESLPTRAEKKARREIAEFRHFEQIIREFIEVNASICRARPLAEAPSASQKKNDGGSLRNGRQRIRASTPTDFCRSPSSRPSGPGSGRNGHSLHRPSNRCGRRHRTAAI